jgi:D-glycero-D-manno-heptose 1,7-bisphosphate phosphatase
VKPSKHAPSTIFVDRDGVINRKAAEGAYVTSLAELHLIDGSIDALARLSRSGRRVIIATNQQGIAKGLIDQEDLNMIHSTISAAVQSAGGQLTEILVCPHLDGTCRCRKPGVGLFELAKELHPEIDLEDSVMIGDSQSDMEAAHSIGARAIRVADNPLTTRAPGTPIEVGSLKEAADLILEAANV